MNKKEARDLVYNHSFKEDTGKYTGIYLTPRRVVFIIIDSLTDDFESIQKENIRLREIESNVKDLLSCLEISVNKLVDMETYINRLKQINTNETKYR